MTSGPTLSDYLGVFRRRRKAWLIPFAVLFGVSAALATTLPSVYEASATIEIDKQEIPSDLMETTVVVGYIDEQLEILGRRVMSTENLWRMVEERDLYADIRDEDAKHEVLSRIRRNASRKIRYVDVGPEERRRPEASVAVAFTVTYSSEDPETARDVANALAELYVDESRRGRAQRARDLAEFMRGRVDDLEEQVAESEAQLAAFKSEHGQGLPDFIGHNMRMLESIQDRLNQVDQRINSLNQQRIDLENQLAQVEPREQVNLNVPDPETLPLPQQVERLRLMYLRLPSRYSPRHPDLRGLTRDLRALVGEAPKASEVLELVTAAEEERAQLMAARAENGSDHPDVRRLERAVGEYRERLRELGPTGDGDIVMVDNPNYIALRSRLQVVEADLDAEQNRREALSARLGEFDGRLVGSPNVEMNQRVLTRNHENAERAYQDARARLRRAEAAVRVEESELGDGQFRLASRASLPDEPARPQRAGIAVLGFILAAGTGTGFAAMLEYFDRTVRGARGVTALWGGPPIAVIPVILTRSEKRQRMFRLLLGWGLVLALIAGGVLAGWLVYSGGDGMGVG